MNKETKRDFIEGCIFVITGLGIAIFIYATKIMPVWVAFLSIWLSGFTASMTLFIAAKKFREKKNDSLS